MRIPSLKPALLSLTVAVTSAFTMQVALAADPAPATGPTQYTIEIVVFRTNAPLGVAEDWKTEAGGKNPTSTADDGGEDPATPGSQERLSFQPLTSAAFRLAGTDAALRRSANYEVLAHVAWTQPATAFGGNAGVSLSSLNVGNTTLRGQVGLEQGRFLHLNVDLSWTPNDPPASLLGGAQGPVTFAIKQKRRVKTAEQHYFDHPAFGVIAIVTPVS